MQQLAADMRHVMNELSYINGELQGHDCDLASDVAETAEQAESNYERMIDTMNRRR